MEEFLGKKYVLVSYENFEDYLVYIGLGYLARKAALSLKPVHSLILNEDGTYSFEFTSALVSHRITFTPGVNFVEGKPDGGKVQALIILDGNKMIHTQTEDNGRTSKHVREFFADSMIAINEIASRPMVRDTSSPLTSATWEKSSMLEDFSTTLLLADHYC